MSDQKQKWRCPVCGGNAYQRYGGTRVKVTEFRGDYGEHDTFRTMGTHFMCKGCSVFFSNPKLFNREKVERRQLMADLAIQENIMKLITGEMP